MDYQKIPLFDNHSHPLDPTRLNMTPDQMALEWLHGFRDDPGGKVSPWLNEHVHNQGSVLVLTHMLAELFGCEENLEAIAAERARRLQGGVKPYAEELYKDGGIFCTLIDSDLPWGDPLLDLFPGKVIRHIQMDPIFYELLKTRNTYAQLRDAFVARIKELVAKGYVSIKSHIGEEFSMDVRLVQPEEAEAAMADARGGNRQAQRTVYYAIFHQAMLTAQELHVPIHVHSGITGGYWDGRMDDCDPYKMGPFLRNVPHMQQTDLVLLHSNYPYMGGAAMMAQAFPHVWVDLAWVLPWTALAFDRALEDLLAIAPVTKILLGSGQHNVPEIAWLSAKVARRSLEGVMKHLVEENLISPEQGFRMAEQIMFRNACRLYNIPEPV